MWASLDEARRWWPESAAIADDTLSDLLDAAAETCARFAGADVTVTPVPISRRMANVYQARDVYAARQADATGDVTAFAGEYLIRPRAMSAQVRGLLRPPRGAVAR